MADERVTETALPWILWIKALIYFPRVNTSFLFARFFLFHLHLGIVVGHIVFAIFKGTIARPNLGSSSKRRSDILFDCGSDDFVADIIWEYRIHHNAKHR
jgi:hypothetical protein